MTIEVSIGEKREILGRLYLWHECVGEVIRKLKLADRAWVATTQSNIAAEESGYLSAFQLNVQPSCGSIKSSDITRFNAQYPIRPFPITTECTEIARSCRMLAVVIFGQTIKPGRRMLGSVANSDGTLMEPYRAIVGHDLLTQGIDEASYRALINAVEWYRDKMLAHADGQAFEIIHSHPASSHKMIESGLDKIDFDLLLKVCEVMLQSIFWAWQPLLDDLHSVATNS